eukprot:scpid81177/ scgid8612/ E-selectin; CD62 antigen-like family member E; Endothelial leukocyte adhesion molecule 1; Leukocyte-endothelial cell adhesion molecule 2
MPSLVRMAAVRRCRRISTGASVTAALVLVTVCLLGSAHGKIVPVSMILTKSLIGSPGWLREGSGGTISIPEGGSMNSLVCLSSPGAPDSVNLTIYYEDGRVGHVPATSGVGVSFRVTTERKASGRYVCRAGNSANSAPVTLEYRVQVEFDVELTVPRTRIAAIAGAPLLLQCMVAQRPEFVDSVLFLLPQGSNIGTLLPVTSGQAPWKPRVATGVNKTRASMSDAGVYTCAVSYGNGYSTPHFKQVDITVSVSIVTCPTLADPKNGLVSLSPSKAEYRTIATYHCAPGYGVSGATSQISCTIKGTWSAAVPSCIPITCTAPSAPTNGRVVTSRLSYLGSSWFTCDSGYTLIGIRKIICNKAWGWSDSTPSCTINSCPDP